MPVKPNCWWYNLLTYLLNYAGLYCLRRCLMTLEEEEENKERRRLDAYGMLHAALSTTT